MLNSFETLLLLGFLFLFFNIKDYDLSPIFFHPTYIFSFSIVNLLIFEIYIRSQINLKLNRVIILNKKHNFLIFINKTQIQNFNFYRSI